MVQFLVDWGAQVDRYLSDFDDFCANRKPVFRAFDWHKNHQSPINIGPLAHLNPPKTEPHYTRHHTLLVSYSLMILAESQPHDNKKKLKELLILYPMIATWKLTARKPHERFKTWAFRMEHSTRKEMLRIPPGERAQPLKQHTLKKCSRSDFNIFCITCTETYFRESDEGVTTFLWNNQHNPKFNLT